VSSDYLKASLNGSGSCINSSNSAINILDKDRTVPAKAIIVCRGSGDAFSLNFKDSNR
jgi:hypothetical protein